MNNAGVKWIFYHQPTQRFAFMSHFSIKGSLLLWNLYQPTKRIEAIIVRGLLVLYSTVALDYHSTHQFYNAEDCIVMMLMYLTRQEQKTNERVLYCLIYIILYAAVGDWRSIIIPRSKLFKLYADKSPTMLIFDVYGRTF